MQKCPECKKTISKNDLFCPNCGKRLPTSKKDKKAKKKSISFSPKSEATRKELHSKAHVLPTKSRTSISEKVQGKKADTFLAPPKEKISLEEKKEKAPYTKGLFFIVTAIILIILLIPLSYFLIPKNSFQKLLKTLPSKTIFLITLNKREDSQNHVELFKNAQGALSKKLEESNLDIQKIEPFLEERVALILLSNNKKLESAYFFEIQNKKEILEIINSSVALSRDTYKEIPFYSNKEKNTIFLLDDFLVLANHDTTIKIIESYKKGGDAFKKSTIRKISRRLKPQSAFAFSYVDISLLREHLESKNLKKYSSLLNNFEAAAMTFEKGVIKGFITHNEPPPRSPLFNPTTLKNAGIETIFLVNSTNLGKNLESLLNKEDVHLSYLKNLITERGINLEDLLALARGEFSFFISLKEGQSQNNFVSEIQDIELAKEKIKNIKAGLENYFATKAAEKEIKTLPDGTKATYLKLPDQAPKFKKEIYEEIPFFSLKNGGEELAYAFFDKKIFISSRVASLKEMLNLSKSCTSTQKETQDKKEKAVLKFFKNESPPQNYHLFFYIDPKVTLETFPKFTRSIPENIKNNLLLVPPFSLKALFSHQGIILEGKIK